MTDLEREKLEKEKTEIDDILNEWPDWKIACAKSSYVINRSKVESDIEVQTE